MRTSLGIQALIGDEKTLHRLSADNVRLNDLVYIGRLYASVPDRLGIHHHRGPVLALLQATGFVRANLVSSNPVLQQPLLEYFLQLARPRWIARSSVVLRRPLVLANKNVFLKLRH